MRIYVVPDPNETKLEYLKRRADAKFQACKDWARRNKEAIIVLTPILIGGVATIVKVVGERANLNKEEAVKNLYCYDRSLGHYWALRRALSNKEWLEIDARKKTGERLSDILDELSVLK
ncbi:MAG: hypothetical protein RSD95_08560 [Clostridia bacterium]